jgi:hypothetical protein
MESEFYSRKNSEIDINQRKERTTLKVLFQQCLNKKEQDSLRKIRGMQSLYCETRMWENAKYLEIRRLGLENYLNQVIANGVSLTSEGIIFVSHALKSNKGLSEITRTKVIFIYYFEN